jgi:membrane protease YdiL (CAAX protease family)
MVVVAIVLAWWDIDTTDLFAVRQALDNGLVLALAVLAAAPPFLVVMALAVRFARASFTDYLALVPPRRRDLLLALALLIVILPLGDLITWLSGRDILHPFMVSNYLTAREAGPWAVAALAGAIVIAAPLTEEILFRGFLYRGWAASPLGPAGAIALASAIWTVVHIQYETFFLVQVFGLGLLFGWLRWRSGSTLLTILLHFLVNCTALAQTAIVLAWRS